MQMYQKFINKNGTLISKYSFFLNEKSKNALKSSIDWQQWITMKHNKHIISKNV